MNEHRQIKAGIAIDDWKLPIFTAHLREAGYTFKTRPGVTADTLLLTVETDNGIALQKVVESANRECAISRKVRGS